MSENPNTNCLDGMQCPSCNSFGPFRIQAQVVLIVHDDGTEVSGDTEWDDFAHCVCKCGHEATVGGFTRETQEADLGEN